MSIRGVSITATGLAWMILGGMVAAQEATDATPSPQLTRPRLQTQVGASPCPVCGCALPGGGWLAETRGYSWGGRNSLRGGRGRMSGRAARGGRGAYRGWGYAWSDGRPSAAALDRTVTVTEDGFDVLIETTDLDRVAAVQQQARARADDGLMGRGLDVDDPLFAALSEHREALVITTENTEQGVRIMHRGATPEATTVVVQLGERLRDTGHGRSLRRGGGRRAGRQRLTP